MIIFEKIGHYNDIAKNIYYGLHNLKVFWIMTLFLAEMIISKQKFDQ